jgi:hypothetical protein
LEVSLVLKFSDLEVNKVELNVDLVTPPLNQIVDLAMLVWELNVGLVTWPYMTSRLRLLTLAYVALVTLTYTTNHRGASQFIYGHVTKPDVCDDYGKHAIS